VADGGQFEMAAGDQFTVARGVCLRGFSTRIKEVCKNCRQVAKGLHIPKSEQDLMAQAFEKALH
jgi:hypothetical protein